MTKSESIKEIAPAFLAAQTEMQAAPKDARNPHFDSRYSDFASVVSAVKPFLNGHDIAYLQPVRLSEAGVEIETILLHKSGEFFSETLSIPVDRRNAQGVGSAISYGKRYGLQSICGLPSDDDDGNAATAGERPQTRTQRPAPPPRPPAPPIERMVAGDIPDDEKFVATLRDAFEARGFQPTEFSSAVAAVCKKKKVTVVTKLSAEDRKAFLESVAAGDFDKMKKKVA